MSSCLSSALGCRPAAPPGAPPSEAARSIWSEFDLLDSVAAGTLAAVAVAFLVYVCFCRQKRSAQAPELRAEARRAQAQGARSRTVVAQRRARTGLASQDAARENAPPVVELVEGPQRARAVAQRERELTEYIRQAEAAEKAEAARAAEVARLRVQVDAAEKTAGEPVVVM